jgi:hypothetical protein
MSILLKKLGEENLGVKIFIYFHLSRGFVWMWGFSELEKIKVFY